MGVDIIVAHALQYKGFRSIVQLALSDAGSCFTSVDNGQCGRVSAALVFQNSVVYNLFEGNQFNFPQEYFKFSTSDDQIPFIIVEEALIKS